MRCSKYKKETPGLALSLTEQVSSSARVEREGSGVGSEKEEGTCDSEGAEEGERGKRGGTN